MFKEIVILKKSLYQKYNIGWRVSYRSSNENKNEYTKLATDALSKITDFTSSSDKGIWES